MLPAVVSIKGVIDGNQKVGALSSREKGVVGVVVCSPKEVLSGYIRLNPVINYFVFDIKFVML